ncbi:MAG: Rha family transcriptional regulator [Rhodoferax sp.]|nr:Rha family transcriptional regulator [Rhodoferax sp.]
MSTPQTPVNLRPRIQVVKNTPMATSLAVAEHFGKEHFNVTRDLRKLIADLADAKFTQVNFMELVQLDRHGREQKYFRMTELGFSMLVMGFTGLRATQWKRAYAEAFMAMRAELEDPVRILKAEIERLRRENPEAAQLEAASVGWAGINTRPSLFSRLQLGTGVPKWDRLIDQVEQQRWDLLKLQELKTRIVPDPRRLGAAETVLRLTYALSKNEAPVLWFLLNESLHTTWATVRLKYPATRLPSQATNVFAEPLPWAWRAWRSSQSVRAGFPQSKSSN